jgi:hypothetical protein
LELLIEPDTYHHFPRGEVIMKLTSTMLKRLIAEEVEEFRVRREVRRALREASNLSAEDEELMKRIQATVDREEDIKRLRAALAATGDTEVYTPDERAALLRRVKSEREKEKSAATQGMPATVEGFLRARRRR